MTPALPMQAAGVIDWRSTLKTSRFGIASLVIAFWSVPSGANEHAHRVDFPGATGTFVLGANDRGQFVGLYVAAGASHAMFGGGGHLAALDPNGLGANPRSRAYALNNLGDIVGSYNDASGGLHGYVFRHGVVTTIDAPGGEPTEAYGINDWGVIIGVFYDADGNPHGYTLRNGVFAAAEVPGSVATNPLSINDRGEIVGEVIDVAGTVGHGYLERCGRATTRIDAPDAPPDSTYFASINNRDQILGAFFDLDGNQMNFVLTRGTFTPFDLPASFNASFVVAQTINDLGQVVGYYFDEAGMTHGFLASADIE
jgi:uncharacterized membrane protein